jgi:hypothetical protein
MKFSKENLKYSAQCNLVHHKSHMTWGWTRTAAVGRRQINRLRYVTDPFLKQVIYQNTRVLYGN